MDPDLSVFTDKLLVAEAAVTKSELANWKLSNNQDST